MSRLTLHLGVSEQGAFSPLPTNHYQTIGIVDSCP